MNKEDLKCFRIAYCPKCSETHYVPLSPEAYKHCNLCGAENKIAILSIVKGKLQITYDDKATAYLLSLGR